jgi:hypothetical protein
MKLDLGSKWADMAGERFSYFMVFDTNPPNGAWAFNDFIEVIQKM